MQGRRGGGAPRPRTHIIPRIIPRSAALLQMWGAAQLFPGSPASPWGHSVPPPPPVPGHTPALSPAAGYLPKSGGRLEPRLLTGPPTLPGGHAALAGPTRGTGGAGSPIPPEPWGRAEAAAAPFAGTVGAGGTPVGGGRGAAGTPPLGPAEEEEHSACRPVSPPLPVISSPTPRGQAGGKPDPPSPGGRPGPPVLRRDEATTGIGEGGGAGNVAPNGTGGEKRRCAAPPPGMLGGGGRAGSPGEAAGGGEGGEPGASGFSYRNPTRARARGTWQRGRGASLATPRPGRPRPSPCVHTPPCVATPRCRAATPPPPLRPRPLAFAQRRAADVTAGATLRGRLKVTVVSVVPVPVSAPPWPPGSS